MKIRPPYEFLRLIAPIACFTIAISAQAGSPSEHMDAAASSEASESSVASTMTSTSASVRHAALIERAMDQGTLPIIVRFKTEDDSTSTTSTVQPEGISSADRAKQNEALEELGLGDGFDRDGEPVKRFDYVDGLAMHADALDLMDLIDNPDVEAIYEDTAYPPALADSVPLIGGDSDFTFQGYSGDGQVIAILDTGVDKTHEFLADKVVSEACYSSSYPSDDISSVCPDGSTESTATDSGVNCTSSIEGCSHGTHVAGIAAGSGTDFSGVAKDAKIISIQVYSLFPSEECDGSPCVMAYTSDIIKGLERVYELKDSYDIAAVNLSLGSGAYTSACDDDATKSAIDALKSEGIATVVASGNSGYTNAVASPGCVSTAVTVGSTTKADEVSSFSNSSELVDLLAPGSEITSSIVGGEYEAWSGTSMAAPHVAGAWAVLKSAYPEASVGQILTALQDSGQSILDPGNNLTFSRIQVDTALTVVDTTTEEEETPDAPTANSASNVSSNAFNASWSSVSGATGYRLDLSNSSSFSSYLSGGQDIDVGNLVAVRVAGLTAGKTYYYRVRAYNDSGSSSNSNVIGVTTTAQTMRPRSHL